ncbi:uroporphyrinogen-III C-methyltransferase [Alteribacillus sp. HJP-4]|uniref:uroporphyrinogen-III C-methyltransferase n=1 Tax=Alteribacillus sp. HJP-4 TaxID=2775394 RepID=UPI0035CD1805
MAAGSVFLVGAGPGDEGLITVKGLSLIKKADVILYDRLVNPLLLEYAREDAERIYCGKLPDRHHLRQDAIQQIMVDKAKQGCSVVRLKGGDPGMFGRVGEEAAALKEHGIFYEIVPGITAGMAAPLYAGVPITHRDYSGSFAAVTGHRKTEEGQPSPDWKSLAKGVDTIAFYMGVKNLPLIAENLLKHGKAAETPVIIIEWATTGRQRTVKGTLAAINHEAQKEKVQNPAITLVGDVAGLNSQLAWFESRPLHGKYVWLVKTASSRSTIAEKLKIDGAEVIEAPRFEVISSEHPLPANLSSFNKIIFTSPESVDFFFEALKKKRIDIRSITADFVGKTKRVQTQLESLGIFSNKEMSGEKVLEVGEEDSLTKKNTSYNFWISHEVKKRKLTENTLGRLITDNVINTVVFPCAKAVKNAEIELKQHNIEPVEWFRSKSVICYGTKSRKAAQAAGISVNAVLAEPNAEKLLQYLYQTPEMVL